MSPTTIAPIERTVRTTNSWLDELKEELGLEDRDQAYHVLRAVLHALRDRLTVAETVDLGAQLPMLLRGLYYEGWTPTEKPRMARKREEFLEQIAVTLRKAPEIYPEAVAWGLFKVLEKHVSQGELRDVKAVLSPDIRALWPRSEAGHGA
jgi:uncharacterized protein (DUF2267 family)